MVFNIVTISISLAALILSVCAMRTTRRIATSDFRAAQQVKSFSMRLSAALISLVYKAASHTAIRPDGVPDMHREKQTISEFLNSPSGLAYLMFVAQKSRVATDAEPWRSFAWKLNNITTTNDPSHAARVAIEVLNLLFEVTESDIEDMSNSVSDLPRAFASIQEVLQEDPLLKAFFTVAANLPKDASLRGENADNRSIEGD